MFIEARCPRCGRDYKLAPHLKGKTVKCKECQAAFPVADSRAGIQAGSAVPVLPLAESVPEAEECRPRIRYEEEADGLRRRQVRKSGGQLVLMLLALVGGVGVLMVLVLLGVFFFLRGVRTASLPTTRRAATHAFPGNGFEPAPNWPEPQMPPPRPPPVPEPVEPLLNDPAFRHLPPELPLLPNPVPERVAWKVEPDPGPDLSHMTVKAGAPLPLQGHADVVFPTTPSRFVAVRSGPLVRQSWQVIDLERFEDVAAFAQKLDLHDPVLSPDGKWLAGKGTPAFGADSIPIVSVAEKRVVRTITLQTQTAFLHRIDFLDSSRLLTLKSQGLASVCEIFEVSSGRRLKEFSILDLLVRPRTSLALSPGGKYLAVAHDSQVDLYHTGEGRLAGRLSLAEGHALFEGLAFSPDGKELACLLQDLGNSARLISWKMATGKPAVQHSFAKDIKSVVPNAFAYSGEVVQWAPDGSGWLLYGAAWIDHGSGALLYQVPHDAADLRGLPRRLFGKDQLVLARPSGADYQLTSLSLPLAAARKASPGKAAVGALPAAVPAHLDGARKLPAPAGEVAWSVKPGPAPLPRSKLAAVQLGCKAQDIQQVLFASGDAAKAVVLTCTTPDPLAPRRLVRAERYDLAGARLLDACLLFPGDALPGPPALQADLSPDGTRLAVRQTKDGGRLDVWDLARGKHLVGWKPVEGGNVDGFAFLDADRLLTSGQGKLILWKVPECQAVYVAEGYRGAFALSPDRKLVAAGTGTTLEILDAATGECRGRFKSSAEAGGLMVAAAFRPDGEQLAAVLDSPAGKKLAHWSLSGGELLVCTSFSGGTQPLSWAGPRHVLQGNTLYSLTFPAPIALYPVSGRGLLAGAGPDGRCWLASQVQDSTLLTAQALPDERALALTASLKAEKPEPVRTYQLDVSAPELIRAAVEKALQERLHKQGWKQGAGGLTVSVSVRGGRTGKTMQYTRHHIGPGRMGRTTITVTELQATCRYIVTDAEGAVLARAGATFRTPMTFVVRGDNVQAQVDAAVWNNARSWSSSVGLPMHVYRLGGKLQRLPMVSALGAKR